MTGTACRCLGSEKPPPGSCAAASSLVSLLFLYPSYTGVLWFFLLWDVMHIFPW